MGKPSDMRKFMKALEKDAKDIVTKQAVTAKYDIECPKCHANIKAQPGRNVCPKCGEEINLKLDINL